MLQHHCLLIIDYSFTENMKILKTHSLLGEGLAYLKTRQRIVAFDILGRKIYLIDPAKDWSFEGIDIPFRGSCAMELPNGNVLIAGDHTLYETSNFTDFDILHQHDLAPDMRMNDGREDPLGRFWYSSMAMNADRADGAVYCYDPKTKTTKTMFENLTIPNAICFDAHRGCGYVADSVIGVINRFDYSDLDPKRARFIDISSEAYVPDGAVVDDEGCLWNAQWGAARVARYSPEGNLLSTVDIAASQASCPLLHDNHLIVTSARVGLSNQELLNQPEAGNIFITPL